MRTCKDCARSRVSTEKPMPEPECEFCDRSNCYFPRSWAQRMKFRLLSKFNDDYKMKDRWISPKTWMQINTR